MQAANDDDAFTYQVFFPSVYVEIYRRDNNRLLCSTARGPLMATNNYLEWSFYLNAVFLVGAGQFPLVERDNVLMMNNENNFSAPFILAYGR